MNSETTIPTLVAGLKRSISLAFQDFDRWTTEEKRSSRHFSERLFGELPNLARELGLDIRVTAMKPRNWEFLYDVCFLVTTGAFNDADGYLLPEVSLKRAVLVLECEWQSNEKEILYDFSKLLMARAQLRCLVFYRSSPQNFEVVMGHVRSAIRDYVDGHPRSVLHLCLDRV